MTSTVLKMNANGGPQFTYNELNGMKDAFDMIRGLNSTIQTKEGPQIKPIDAKVDYWLTKNEAILDAVLKPISEQDEKVLMKYIKTYENKKFDKPVRVWRGKDDEDTFVGDVNLGYFDVIKKTAEETKDGEELEYLVEIKVPRQWEKVTPAEKEGEEPKVEKVGYEVFWLTENSKAEFHLELFEMHSKEKYPVQLYKLKHEGLSNLQIVKVNRQGQPIEDFVKLIYDNAISE